MAVLGDAELAPTEDAEILKKKQKSQFPEA
jgi:hypothetical protein